MISNKAKTIFIKGQACQAQPVCSAEEYWPKLSEQAAVVGDHHQALSGIRSSCQQTNRWKYLIDGSAALQLRLLQSYLDGPLSRLFCTLYNHTSLV